MRKFIEQEIVNLIETLKDAITQVDQLVKSEDYSSAFEVLVVCQQGAISIGTTIERSRKDAGEVITELEAYCENIYQLSINLEKTDYDFNLAYSILNNQLSCIKDFIENKIKINYEIVFLPYKASMWDSLESIWKTASQDPSCKCYVIPIPYYERNDNSSSAVMKYEGTMMPPDVPITSYESYNFKERKPDIIYMHNPYDQYNLVTSVHPSFYSSELKKYTNQLVYVPYFVTGGSVADSFKNLSVYNYMDKMVVQSDKIANFYKKYVAAEKIVVLGSPKIDKILSIYNGKKEIPKEWEYLIRNRKVVFYNTSLSGLLEYGEKALDKMESIFSCFTDREDEVLLWRPHPLSKATLQAMRPEMHERYCNLEQRFILNNIGILDTTPDVTLSVVISDAYIGEESSSIVHLFGVIGKPIFVLDMELREKRSEELKNLVGALDVWIENDDLWFVHSNYNALCKMDINTGKVQVLDKIPNETLLEERLYQDVLKVNEKLYFTPHRAKELLEYNLCTGQFNKFPLRKTTEYNITQFTRMVRYKDYLFLLPTHYPAIVRYDLRNGSFKYYFDIIRKLKKFNKGERRNIPEFMNAVCVEGDLLIMASARSNIIVELNMNTNRTQIYKVGSEENNYYRMEYDGDDYWLIPNESKSIVRWNRKTGKTVEYNDFPENFQGDKNAFLNIIYCGKYMLAFPKNSNMILKIDIRTGNMSELNLDLPYREGERKECYYNWPNNYYFVKKLDDVRILAMSAYDSSIIIINIVTGECSIKKCIIEDRKVMHEFGRCSDNLPYACRENGYVMIEDFLNGIEDQQIFSSEEQKKAYETVINNMDGSCGRKIHRYMVEQLQT
jgi:hypothetical protein